MALPGAIPRLEFLYAWFRDRRYRRWNPKMGAPPAPRSNGWGPGDRTAKAKYEVFAITVNGRNTIGVVSIDLERGVPVWNSITGTGLFTGSIIITL
jgi:hypothetical protein